MIVTGTCERDPEIAVPEGLSLTRHIKMNIDHNLIEATVYHHNPVKEQYYVKIAFLGTGMYINSFSVKKSQYPSKPFWVQPPQHWQGNKWVPTLDFDRNYDLWKIIETKSLQAVLDFRNEKPTITRRSSDVVLEDIDSPLDLSSLPE